MKKIISILAGALLITASTFAMDLSVGIKGNLGGDASGIDGTALGGGAGINASMVSTNTVEDSSDLKMTLAAGLNAKCYILGNKVVSFKDFAKSNVNQSHCKKIVFFLPIKMDYFF